MPRCEAQRCQGSGQLLHRKLQLTVLPHRQHLSKMLRETWVSFQVVSA